MNYKTVYFLFMLVSGCWALQPLIINYTTPTEFTVYMNEEPLFVNHDVHVSRNFELLKYSEGSLKIKNVALLDGEDIHGIIIFY